ncbi:unnamed protein product [Ambrosiozyma monospora]|uniref:Unnamed protein product n=1 Tax=Ambrosiozyma monospora TaxID=43982 RepID=A0ACB5TUV6_AMBMO|nr:unnamed protein product [Ambrosiozyma monospora]
MEFGKLTQQRHLKIYKILVTTTPMKNLVNLSIQFNWYQSKMDLRYLDFTNCLGSVQLDLVTKPSVFTFDYIITIEVDEGKALSLELIKEKVSVVQSTGKFMKIPIKVQKFDSSMVELE